jgi:DNA mismatch repair protein MutS2
MPLLPDIPGLVAPSQPLEWDKFVAFLGGYTQSALGRAWIAALVPSTDREWVARQQRLVAEMRLLVAAGIMPQLRALFDPTDLLAKARIEGVALESAELRAVIALAEEITSWAELMRNPPQIHRTACPS